MSNEKAIMCLEDMKIKVPIPKAAKQARENNEALDVAIKALKNEPHWIPVTERLPEKGIDVLVTRKYDGREDGNKSCCYVEVASCFGQDDGVTWNSYSDEYKMHPRNHSVIAWMPLPEPFKEVTE